MVSERYNHYYFLSRTYNVEIFNNDYYSVIDMRLLSNANTILSKLVLLFHSDWYVTRNHSVLVNLIARQRNFIIVTVYMYGSSSGAMCF